MIIIDGHISRIIEIPRTGRKILNSSAPLQDCGSIFALSGLPLIRFKLARIWRHAFSAPRSGIFSSPAGQVQSAARWHIAGYAWLWPVPNVRVMVGLVFLVGALFPDALVIHAPGVGEHTGLTHRPETLFNTRTFRTGFFFRWVNWNMTYHWSSHLSWSAFYRLPGPHRKWRKISVSTCRPHLIFAHWQQFRRCLPAVLNPRSVTPTRPS
ncbi:MAG: hypothetical protein CM1200mP20_03560 [Pseudomonadota bacterium]|nr:MAG: hypothetical protein CM1200mP20_03560 [Pseudomonadota bacterium]